jgi:hypothetical protein
VLGGAVVTLVLALLVVVAVRRSSASPEGSLEP